MANEYVAIDDVMACYKIAMDDIVRPSKVGKRRRYMTAAVIMSLKMNQES